MLIERLFPTTTRVHRPVRRDPNYKELACSRLTRSLGVPSRSARSSRPSGVTSAQYAVRARRNLSIGDLNDAAFLTPPLEVRMQRL